MLAALEYFDLSVWATKAANCSCAAKSTFLTLTSACSRCNLPDSLFGAALDKYLPNKNGACGLLYLRFPQPVWQICPLWCLPNICSRTNQFCRVHTANNHISSFDTMIFQRFVIVWQVFHLRCVKIIISCCACFQYLIGAFFFSRKAFSCVQCLYVVRQRNRFRYRTKQFDKSGLAVNR